MHRTLATFDWAGSILVAAAVVACVLLLAWGGRNFAWTSWQALALGGAAAVCAGAAVVVERRAQEPIFPPELFKNRNFLLCGAAGFCLYVAFFGTISYLPTYMQIVRGLTPEAAGLACAPMSVGMLVTSVGAGWLAGRSAHWKWMPVAMFAVCGVAFWLMAGWRVQENLALELGTLALLGAGIGLGSQLLVLVVQNEFPARMVGTATAANNFMRQIGSTVGACVVGGVFTARLTAELAGRLPDAAGISVAQLTPALVDHLPHAARQVVAQAYAGALEPIFLWFVPLCAAGLVLTLLLRQTPLRKK
jgi:predicted MFS family arabinose efflux permease